MRIGIPRERKNHEYRIAITPGGAALLIMEGHQVFVEPEAGAGSGFLDSDFLEVGAHICVNTADVWSCDMVLKVKEPIPEEYGYLHDRLILFTYLHLAAAPELAHALQASGTTAIAYETVTDAKGGLPLLVPMSEVAGRMSIQVGARCLEHSSGGRGVLLGGVPGVPPADVVILGGGIVGTNAAKMALGLGASVVMIDRHMPRLRELDDLFLGRVRTLMSNPIHIAAATQRADLLIGAVLILGARAPKLVSEDMVRAMKSGSVIVDVAVDQGGSIETVTHVTTHSNPTYVKHDVVHYAVANMPGAVPRTSTLALTNVKLPYVLTVARNGVEKAAKQDVGFAAGINIYQGMVVHQAVAEALELPCVSLQV